MLIFPISSLAAHQPFYIQFMLSYFFFHCNSRHARHSSPPTFWLNIVLFRIFDAEENPRNPKLISFNSEIFISYLSGFPADYPPEWEMNGKLFSLSMSFLMGAAVALMRIVPQKNINFIETNESSDFVISLVMRLSSNMAVIFDENQFWSNPRNKNRKFESFPYRIGIEALLCWINKSLHSLSFHPFSNIHCSTAAYKYKSFHIQQFICPTERVSRVQRLSACLGDNRARLRRQIVKRLGQQKAIAGKRESQNACKFHLVVALINPPTRRRKVLRIKHKTSSV